MVIAKTALKKPVQIGNETTPGTAVAATELLYVTSETPIASQVLFYPEDDRNNLYKNQGNEFKVGELAEITIEMNMNSLHMPFLFANAIRGNVTPTQPDAVNEANTWLWNFIMNTAPLCNAPETTNGIDTFTLEAGDNVDDYQYRYCFTKTIEITGAPGEPVKVTWTITAADVVAGVTPAVVSAPVVQYFPANTVNFYIDANYAAIGTTVVVDFLKEWTWKLETMFTPRVTASGSYAYTGVNEASKEVELSFEYLRSNGQDATELAKFKAIETSFMRIEIVGPTELDSGEDNPPKVQLDMAVRYSEVEVPDDSDGSRTTSYTAKSVLDPVAAKSFEVNVYTVLSDTDYPTV